MWIDTHCHPFAKPLLKDLDAVLARADEAGVSKMIIVGCNGEWNKEAVAMAKDYPGKMWATVGLHPCDAGEMSEELFEEMERFAREEDCVVAIGETGLDMHHKTWPLDQQDLAFRRQIHLAKELGLPLVVHSRDAAEETLRILDEEQAEKVIFHCYSYGAEYGKKVWERGYYTSFSGVVTYPQAKEVQEAAKIAPAELILLETDCPWLAPQTVRGKRNEMAYVVEVGEKVAGLRGIEPAELAKQVMGNARGLFGI